jgi:transcriptional regulator with XRE-family HTH domain
MKLHELDNVTIGQALRFRRTLCSLTVEKVAGELGISHQQYSKFERGENRVTLLTFMKLAQIFGCSPHAWLAAIKASVDPTETVDAFVAVTQQEKFLLAACRKINEDQLAAIIRVMSVMVPAK